MSLTYSQKQFIQQHYLEMDIETMAENLKISPSSVESHMGRNKHLFTGKKKKRHSTSAVIGVEEQLPFKKWFKEHWINLLILVGLVILVYINAFTADFVSDDIQGIQERANALKSWEYFMTSPRFFARTFQMYLAFGIGGMNPFVYRLFNFFFHIGNVILVYRLVPFFSKKQYLPFLVAVLVAVHPMMIESVTWISGGIYAHAAFCVLLSFLLYLMNREKNNIWITISSLIVFVLGLSASEKIIVYPIVLLFYEFSFGNLARNWKKSIPYFMVSVGWAFILMQSVNDRLTYLQTTNGTQEKVHIYNPLTQIPIALGTYMKLYVYPRHLTLYHSDFYHTVIELIALYIYFFLYIGAWIWSYFKNRKIFFWMGFFLITISPTLNPFGLSWVVAERYAYLGSVGIFFIVGYLIHKLIDSEKYKTLGYLIFIIMLIGFSIRTLVRNYDWQNVDNLWIATGKASPSDPKTHNNLGDMYARHGDMEMAIKEFSIATQLNPNYSAAYYNIGNTYNHMKNKEMALKFFLLALQKNPGIWQAYMNIAIIYFDAGRIDEAEKYLKEGLKYNPTNASMYSNLGVVSYSKGNKKEALEYLQKALQIEPTNQFARQWYDKISSGK